jgi:DNA-binding PadR family transcriptional regulator
MSRITRLEEDILTSLMSEELYCKDLRDKINGESKKFPVTSGSLYPSLNSLSRRGYLDDRWDDEGDNVSRRKVYRISGLGRQALEEIYERRTRLSMGLIPALRFSSMFAEIASEKN